MSFYDAIRVGASGAADFEVERSLRFNRSDEAYLEATLGNSNLNKWTLSVWVKKPVNGEHQAILASGDSSVYTMVNFGNSDRIKFTNYPGSNAGVYITTRKFRDPSAWYHIVAIWDSGNSTAADRIRIYVNGVRETAFDQSDNPNQNQNSVINGNTQGGSTWGNGKHRVGRFSNYTDYTGCYYAEVNFVDGQAYDPSYFAETNAVTGQWNPKKYTGSYGTNGFYLNFSDNSGTTATTLGKDSSGNGNNFTPNNFSVSAGIGYDSMADTPTNNFPTLSPFDKSSDIVLYNGNLRYSFASRPNVRTVRATFTLPSSGKYYWEFCNEQASNNPGRISMGVVDITVAGQAYNTNPNSNGYIQYSYGGGLNINGSSIGVGASWYNTERAAIAVDCDTGKFWFGKVASNGSTTWYNSTAGTDGNPATGSNQTTTLTTPSNFMPFGGWNEGGNGSEFFSASINFGQQPFLGTEPTGYVKLSSANLPDPTILLPNNHFDSLLYSGTGSANSVTGLNFAPDWVWAKVRSHTGDHLLVDQVRGGSKSLNSNNTDAESSLANRDATFLSNGIRWNGNSLTCNESGKTYVAWNWNAGDTDGKTYTVTVVDSGGNKFRFDGFAANAVTLDLAEGGTYIFNYPSGHPFRFSTTADGTHGGGSEYTTGVTHNSSTQVTIVVAASAPTLYYYCSSHSGMGGSVNTNSTLGSSNFDGTIQTTVKANTTAGFSIVTYTGNGTNNATIGHGLGVAPVARIGKGRNIGSVGSAGSHWSVNHQNLNNGMNGGSSAGTVFLSLNVAQENNNHGAVGAVSATTMTLSDGSSGSVPRAHVNENNYLYIQYVFSEVAGYSKFGKYSGNGNSNGAFVFTGFRPAWVMIKRTDSSGNWFIIDNKRDTFNEVTKDLQPNNSNAETDNPNFLDFLSNGFKLKTTGASVNSGTMIYLAFAESPFKNARAR